ncbi:MAG: hypothetical protein SGJ20_19285 [Planctomycetota bacterium]|nr:hypothetical protein [Planctomycetota bacterium]
MEKSGHRSVNALQAISQGRRIQQESQAQSINKLPAAVVILLEHLRFAGVAHSVQEIKLNWKNLFFNCP